jgi:hypothetical protein
VYMHFPSLEQLMIDAILGALSQAQVDQTIRAPELGTDAIARVEAMARALQGMSPEVERLGRSLIRLTVENPGGDDGSTQPRRGYRRVEWIETALAPVCDQLDDDDFNRVVCALSMVVGWEALIVQRDICGLTAEQGEEVSVWAARTLAQAAIAEAQRRTKGNKH